MKKCKIRTEETQKSLRGRRAKIPISYTAISSKNLLSAKPPNTTTFDFPTLTAVWPLHPREHEETLRHREINRKWSEEERRNRTKTARETEAIDYLRARGGFPPKSKASALTQCIVSPRFKNSAPTSNPFRIQKLGFKDLACV